MSEPDQRFTLSPRSEWFGVCLILFAFLLINLLVAARTPTVHMDEPVFADPAANLYLGSGFTSTMWGEDHHEFWSSQPPLYTSLLYVFFKCFGFGLFQARAANAFLAAAGAVLIWAGLRRSGFIQTPIYRLMSLVLILSGSASVLTFRMIRYDVVMFLVSGLVFFIMSLPAKPSRYPWLFLASLLLPWSGVPMLPYIALLFLIHFAVYRFGDFSLLVCIGAGIAVGGGLLLLLYHHFGVLQHFFDFVALNNYASRHTVVVVPWKTRIFGQKLGEESLLTSFFGNPFEFQNMKTLFDYSAFLLFVVFVAYTWKMWGAMDQKNRRIILFVLLTVLIVPPVLQFAGHYWSDYRWMTYVPLALAVPRLLELSRATGQAAGFRRPALAAIGLAAFVGIPVRTLVVVPDWSARSVTPLEQVAAQVIKPDDVVISSFKTYFEIRPYAKLVYCFGLSAKGSFSVTKDLPTNEVSLLCLFPTNMPVVVPVVGGKWKQVPVDGLSGAAALSRTRYGISFYRRDTNNVP